MWPIPWVQRGYWWLRKRARFEGAVRQTPKDNFSLRLTAHFAQRPWPSVRRPAFVAQRSWPSVRGPAFVAQRSCHGIVAHHTPTPALSDRLIARQCSAACVRQRKQHFHYRGLNAKSVTVGLNTATGRANNKVARSKARCISKIRHRQSVERPR
jgi:hypothetical protein